jgi:GTPase
MSVPDSDAAEEDWRLALHHIQGLQNQRDHDQAQELLQNLWTEHRLNPREQGQLAAAWDELHQWQQRLEQRVMQIAVFGMVGRGKSSVLNALVGRSAFVTGAVHGVTQRAEAIDWQVAPWEDEWGLDMPQRFTTTIRFIDTPGIDEVAGEQRASIAWEAAHQSDLLLFVVSGDVTEIERSALAQLRECGKPLLLVFNKTDLYSAAECQSLYQKIATERVQELLTPAEIVLVAAAPLVHQLNDQGDLTTQVGAPQITPLAQKILQIFHREGESLVALNAMLAADRLQTQVVQHKMSSRGPAADDRIWQAVMAKGVAVALNPIAAVDLLGGVAIDLGLIVSLAQIYHLPMTKTGAAHLLKTIALGAGGVAGSGWVANLGLSGIKSLLGLAVPATGGLAIAPYTAVALAQAATAGLSTYAVGQVAKNYLAHGASWSDRSPKAVVRDILGAIDGDSILQRIRQELAARLDRP